MRGLSVNTWDKHFDVHFQWLFEGEIAMGGMSGGGRKLEFQH